MKQLLCIVKKWIKRISCVNEALLFGEKNTVKVKTCLDKHYLDSAPEESTVEKWFSKLKRGEMCIEGDARSGRPKEAVSDENIKIPQNNFE
jgi:hypothetical protein